MENPDFRLDGKVALITGSGRGIGAATAKAFASHGCAVAVQDIDLPVAQQLVDEIKSAGGKAVALGGDITNLDDVRAMVPQTVEQLGGIHILINNAAIQSHKHWLELSVDHIERELRA